MSRLAAVVFDVDGVLLDTREYIFAAFEHTLKTHGHRMLARDEMQKNIHGSAAQCYSFYAPDGHTRTLCLTHAEFQAQNSHLVASYEGLDDLLFYLKREGMRLATCSNRGENVIRTLHYSGVYSYFDAVVCSGDVKRTKPYPDGVLKALQMMGVPPERAAMVGDAATDIEAGKAAGVALTIGITHGFGRACELEDAGATHVVGSLGEVLSLLVQE